MPISAFCQYASLCCRVTVPEMAGNAPSTPTTMSAMMTTTASMIRYSVAACPRIPISAPPLLLTLYFKPYPLRREEKAQHIPPHDEEERERAQHREGQVRIAGQLAPPVHHAYQRAREDR